MIRPMISPLRRRAIYSAVTVAIGLSAVYLATLILPDPGKWLLHITTNGAFQFMTAISVIIYGVPSWAVLYLILTILDIPASRRAGKPDGRSSAE